MVTIYKTLPGGGYTAMPVQTERAAEKWIREGWSLEQPTVSAPDAPVEVAAPAVDAEDDAPKRKGRKPRVN